ncbi:MAG: EAL domain-containing protein [Sulfuritalea sp.]|nr:EAL domain-containing protein [Sulfuritalea sp.]
MSSASSLRRRSRFLTEWLVLLAILLTFGAHIGYSQYQEYVQTEAQERERLASETSVIEKNLVPRLLTANKALASIRDDVSRWGATKDGPARIHRQLQVLSDTQPSLRVLLIVNAAGQVTASNNEKLIGASLAHRDWFQLAARNNAPQTLYLVAPIKTLLDTYVMALVRSIAGPNGEFGGVVYGSLDPEFARTQLDSVLYSPDAWAALAHGDGKLFMMAPERKSLVGMDLATPGSLFTRHRNSGRDVNVDADIVASTGENRMIAQRTIQPANLLMDKPLVVAVSRDLNAIFAPWRRASLAQAWMFGLMALICVLSLLFYQRRQRIIEGLAESHQQALRASTDRLNEAQRIAQVGNWTLDLQSGELIWSDEVFRLFEIDKTQFGATYEAFLNVIHPDDRDAVNQAYTDSLTTRLPYEIIHRLRMSDGRIKWVHEKCLSEFDAAGKPLRSLGTVQDVTEREEANIAIRASEASRTAILNSMAASVAVLDRDGVILEVNDTWRRFALENGDEPGKPPAHTEVGVNYLAACKTGQGFPNDNALEARDGIQAVLDGRLPGFRLEYSCHSPTQQRWFIVSVTSLGEDTKGRAVISHTDISLVKKADADLRIAAAAFESQEAMMVTDADGVILRVNRAFTEITGYPAAEAVGRTPSLLKSGRHDAEFYRAMWQTIHRTGGWQGEIWDRRKDGTEYPKWLTISAVKDEQGTVTHYIGAHYDITERKKAEDRINELAFFDQLTGLPNRVLLLDRLRQTMTASSRSGHCAALLFIDLDNFKTLNDTLGHDMGDLLLQQVAQRLSTCVRAGDTVARLGGDEFVVMLANLSRSERDAATQTEAVGEKIIATLNQPYQLKNIAYRSTPSIGVTLFSGQRTEIEVLLKQADLAMYKSKEAGRNALRFFDQDMEVVVAKRAALESDLRAAVQGQQFLLHYQAQVEGGRMTGAEVLVRWEHPQRGMVSPAEFIPLAEETGLILPLGQWVLETACHQLAVWASRPKMAHLGLAVNVSAHQFRQADFVGQVLAVLAKTGANPQRLKLELTESLLVHDVEQIIEKMFALKARGVGFSLDDFGTGYSSLAYLKRLPLDQLKIDQSFVRDVLSDPNDASIARTVIALAKSLGLGVIAEGVETAAQRDFLASSGCHAYQGYFFSKPLPLDRFEAFVMPERVP